MTAGAVQVLCSVAWSVSNCWLPVVGSVMTVVTVALPVPVS